MFRSALLAFTLVAGTASAATQLDIDPSAGAPKGGDLVVLYLPSGGTNPCTSSILCSPSVTFDGIAVRIVRSAPSYVEVETPPHARGDAKVSVVAGATYKGTFHYYSEDDYERVLLPVHIVGQAGGAFGSLWTTSTRIANSGADAVDVKWSACNSLADPPCPPFVHLVPGGGAVPVSPDADGAIPTPGRFIYIPKAAMAQVHTNSRVQDVSRQAETWGTEQPLVPVDDFVKDVLLINVPNDTRFRTTLRIYGSGTFPIRARIRVWPLESNDAPIVDDTRDLFGYVSIIAVPFPTAPAYAELALESYGAIAGRGPLRIEVTPVADTPLWAFASVTNNATQHVTLVTP